MHTNYIERVNQFEEKYRISYSAWGNPDAEKVLFCVHGLNRNSRDFDFVAAKMITHDYYVIAPDLPGRGNSDYLNDPRGYSLECNIADLNALLCQLQITKFDFLGVSLGGILGMMLASLPQNKIRKLVLSDIGAEVEFAGIARIAGYSVQQPDFATYSEACEYLRSLSLSDGIYQEEVWQHMFVNSFQKNHSGRFELKRDLRLATSLASTMNGSDNLEFWSFWERVIVPTLIIHGAHSDLLSTATLQKMQHQNPQTEILTVKDAGHSPYLYREEHLARIAQFINV